MGDPNQIAGQYGVKPNGGISGALGDVGHFFGMGIGSEGYKTDPSQFMMPGMGAMQGRNAAGYAGAGGANAGHIDTSQENSARAQQSMLAQMLMHQANGQGPSLAQQQLTNATDANTRNAMALGQSMSAPNAMAAQRNILGNQAMAQQQAAGQSAMLRSQEQFNAQGQLQSLLGGQRGQDIGLSEGQAGLNAGLAQYYNSANQQNNNAQLQANIAQQQIASGAYQNQANHSQSFVGGLAGGIGSAIGLAHGGMVPHYAQGGGVGLGYFGVGMPDVTASTAPMFSPTKKKKPQGGDLDTTGSFTGTDAEGVNATVGLPDTLGESAPDFMALALARGGPVPDYAMGLQHGHMLAMLMGGGVPGKAKKAGDSGENDTVPAMLSPKEIVLPRSVTLDDDAPEKAKLFVKAIESRKRS